MSDQANMIEFLTEQIRNNVQDMYIPGRYKRQVYQALDELELAIEAAGLINRVKTAEVE